MTIPPSDSPWSIEAYCGSQSPLDLEKDVPHDSSRIFLESFGLPVEHPFCQLPLDKYYLQDIPRQGPLTNTDHLETWWDVVVTVLTLTVPSLAAMAELWLRFFGMLLAPLLVAALLADELSLVPISSSSLKNNDSNPKKENPASSTSKNSWIWTIACLLSVASSIVLLTDTLYILEFGPRLGGSFLVLSVVLSIRACRRHNLVWTQRGIVLLLLLCLQLILKPTTSDGNSGLWFQFGEPMEQTLVSEGLYVSPHNPLLAKAASLWSPNDWSYTYETGATPWMPTGDSRTGLPFLLNRVSHPLQWHRLWLPVENGEEVVALDFCFPEEHGYNASKPVYMVLHGINGGTHEAFIRDFAYRRAVQDGATVVVMVARGLEDLPIRGWNNFHGARWTDAHEASVAIKQQMQPNQLLVGVGYSMGAIILSNLVGRAGTDCALDAAVCLSGGLDMRFQTDFFRAQRLFQPIITVALRDTFVLGKWGERVRQRLTKNQMKALMRGTHITDIDSICIVNYNGFRDVNHYYSEMSLLGDVSKEEYEAGRIHDSRRVHQVATPTVIVHALDDPLITWRTVAANQGAMTPANLTQTGNGNLILLLTKRGGHVGWSTTTTPHLTKWQWMNDVPATFVEALRKAKEEE